jgi:hypothetical protein
MHKIKNISEIIFRNVTARGPFSNDITAGYCELSAEQVAYGLLHDLAADFGNRFG